MEGSSLMPFEGKEIRKIWHNNEWVFSVLDVIEFLTDSPHPKSYWFAVKHYRTELAANCIKLRFPLAKPRSHKTEYLNTEGVLNIAINIRSSKVEELKLWMMQVDEQPFEKTESIIS